MKSTFLLLSILTISLLTATVQTNSLAGQVVMGTIESLRSNSPTSRAAFFVEGTSAESVSQEKPLPYERLPQLAHPRHRGQRTLSAADQTSSEQAVVNSGDNAQHALFLSNPIGTEKLIREFWQ